jgi:hypothetical protein
MYSSYQGIPIIFSSLYIHIFKNISISSLKIDVMCKLTQIKGSLYRRDWSLQDRLLLEGENSFRMMLLPKTDACLRESGDIMI